MGKGAAGHAIMATGGQQPANVFKQQPASIDLMRKAQIVIDQLATWIGKTALQPSAAPRLARRTSSQKRHVTPTEPDFRQNPFAVESANVVEGDHCISKRFATLPKPAPAIAFKRRNGIAIVIGGKQAIPACLFQPEIKATSPGKNRDKTNHWHPIGPTANHGIGRLRKVNSPIKHHLCS